MFKVKKADQEEKLTNESEVLVVHDSVIPWTVAHQVPLSIEFSRKEYWRRLPFPFPDPGNEPGTPALQTDSLPSEPLGKPKNKGWW